MIAKLVIIAAALVILAPRPAQAIRACSEEGIAPAAGTTLPPHAQIVIHSDGRLLDLTARIEGKPVALTRTVLAGSAGINVVVLEVQSTATGRLELVTKGGDVFAWYPIAKVKMPSEVAVTSNRMYRPGTWGTGRTHYNFDGLAIHLPKDVPAIYAHVKVRRDDKAKWSELDVPVWGAIPNSRTTPEVWIGEVGCTSNYSQQLLEKGVDLEVTIGLTDGTRVMRAERATISLCVPASLTDDAVSEARTGPENRRCCRRGSWELPLAARGTAPARSGFVSHPDRHRPWRHLAGLARTSLLRHPVRRAR